MASPAEKRASSPAIRALALVAGERLALFSSGARVDQDSAEGAEAQTGDAQSYGAACAASAARCTELQQ